MGIWGGSILTAYIAALTWIVLARQRGGRYWVDQPTSAMTGVWFFNKFSYNLLISTIPIWISYGEVQGWPHLFIYLFICSFSAYWKLILCLVWFRHWVNCVEQNSHGVGLSWRDMIRNVVGLQNSLMLHTPRWWRKCHFFISYHLSDIPHNLLLLGKY